MIASALFEAPWPTPVTPTTATVRAVRPTRRRRPRRRGNSLFWAILVPSFVPVRTPFAARRRSASMLACATMIPRTRHIRTFAAMAAIGLATALPATAGATTGIEVTTPVQVTLTDAGVKFDKVPEADDRHDAPDPGHEQERQAPLVPDRRPRDAQAAQGAVGVHVLLVPPHRPGAVALAGGARRPVRRQVQGPACSPFRHPAGLDGRARSPRSRSWPRRRRPVRPTGRRRTRTPRRRARRWARRAGASRAPTRLWRFHVPDLATYSGVIRRRRS